MSFTSETSNFDCIAIWSMSSEFVNALTVGDADLSEEDAQNFRTWEALNYKLRGTHAMISEQPHFGKCEISGQFGDVYTVIFKEG